MKPEKAVNMKHETNKYEIPTINLKLRLLNLKPKELET